MNLVFVVTLILGGFKSSEAQQKTEFNRANNMKMTLLSLCSGSARISYEHAIGKKNGAELTLGLIGCGFDILNHAEPAGYLVKAAYKWVLWPQPCAHSSLAGLYAKPELIWADYDYHLDALGITSGGNAPIHHTHQVALLAECGYQLIINWFVFDIYCGLGPTIGTGNAQNYYHGFMCYPSDSWIAYTAGFRLGVAF